MDDNSRPIIHLVTDEPVEFNSTGTIAFPTEARYVGTSTDASELLGYATDDFRDAINSGDEAAIEVASEELNWATDAFRDACESTRTEYQEAIAAAAVIFDQAPEAVAAMAEEVKSIGDHWDKVKTPAYVPDNRANRRASGYRGTFRKSSLAQRAKAA